MEPMTLGSPPTSPSSSYSPFYQNQANVMGTPGLGSAPHTHNGFLPGYLMGEYTQQGSGMMMSPTKMNRSMAASSPAPAAATPKPVGGFLTPQAANLRTPSSEKPAGGPPVTGLFSTPKRLPHSRLVGTPGSMTPMGGTPLGGTSTPVPTTPHLSFGGTPHANNVSKLGDYSQRESDSSTWVTVFGFPPSAASYILSQFSQCGTVLQHHMPTNGNWMHIKYQTRMQAQKALGRSGRVFGGTLMVGVLPCAEPSGFNETSHLETSVFGGLTSPPAYSNDHLHSDSTVHNISSNLNTTKSIRSLTQSYKSAQNELDVSNVSNAPNRNEGIVSKAMEYIFGW